MNRKPARAEYSAALADYVAGAGETALRRAYEAGRHALADGMGVLEMAAAHQEAMLGAMRSANDPQDYARSLARAMSCFAESLSPFEMVLRGVHELHTRLQQSEHELERAQKQVRLLSRNLTLAQDGAEKDFQRAPDGVNGAVRYAPAKAPPGRARQKQLRRLEFLAEASACLLTSLDPELLLSTAARLTVPYLADWCFVTLAAPDETLRQIDIFCALESSASLRRQLLEYSLFRDVSALPAEASVQQVTPEWCDQVAEHSTHSELLRQLRAASALVIPLRNRDTLDGALLLISCNSYQPDDLSLAADLGRRCASALANARRHHQVTAEREAAVKASRAKDEFLAILSHELRNPLMPLVGWTRMLRNQAPLTQDPLLSEGLRSMERNARTLERLVGDCLDLARISEGAIRMERKPVDLNQIMAASIDSVKEMASAKGLRLTVEILQDSIFLLGDSVRLEQVVVNLLVNAVKYTSRGGSVTLQCRRVQDEAEVEVTDSGTGIHPAFLEQIFEPFRRGSNSWLTNQSGLGLGLAIARRIVEMHGGRIWAESAGLDSGSTFRVRLPLAAAAVTESPRELNVTRESEAPTGLRILIVEDSEDILFLLRIELEMAGHSVATAADAKSGLTLAIARRPDLIISDLRMPGIDGFELIRQIRLHPDLALTPAIALTGLGAKADFDRAVAAGFDACVSKPAEPREISALIRSLTDRKRNTSGGVRQE